MRLVRSSISFMVGNKHRVKFLEKWCEDTPLCVSFSSLLLVSLRRSGCRMFGIPQLQGGVATLTSLNLLTVGRWMKWRAFCCT